MFYHCGSSLNHAGSKTFSINQLEDEMVQKLLMNKIGELEYEWNCRRVKNRKDDLWSKRKTSDVR